MDEVRTPKAHTLVRDEKTVMLMVYTQQAMVRGEVVVKESIRVNIWMRTQGAPEYMHFINKPQVMLLGPGGVKAVSYKELYFHTAPMIAYHLAPPASEPPDYDPSEQNRVMEPLTAIVGTFLFSGMTRISTVADINSSLNANRIPWLSLYNLEISNPYLPQMGVMKVPMVQVRPTGISFGVNSQ